MNSNIANSNQCEFEIWENVWGIIYGHTTNFHPLMASWYKGLLAKESYLLLNSFTIQIVDVKSFISKSSITRLLIFLIHKIQIIFKAVVQKTRNKFGAQSHLKVCWINKDRLKLKPFWEATLRRNNNKPVLNRIDGYFKHLPVFFMSKYMSCH